MTTSEEDGDRATGEAARWLVALEEAPGDPGTRARFEAWLAERPGNARAWAETEAVYGLIGRTRPVHARRWRHAARDTGGPAPARRRTVRRRVLAGALAACLAIAGLAGVLEHPHGDHASATGEVRAVALADGSTVRLGPGSAIDVAYLPGERGIRLLRGEAFFEVAPDPDRPFRVRAGALSATALGTAFDIRLGARSTAVAVRSGLVRVERPDAVAPLSARLAAGERVRVGPGGAMERGTVPRDQVAAWLDGRLVARDEPLAEVVDALRRSYAGMIVLADPALGARRVTGVYTPADPYAALRAVVGAHGARVHRLSPWLMVVSGG